MKKIGILFGSEKSFPSDLISVINSMKNKVKASRISLDALKLNDKNIYSLIYDRISHKVPFYKNFLKQSYINGALVINNPFLTYDFSSFIHNVISNKKGIRTPKSVLLPSKEPPENTVPDSFANLNYPLDWNAVFNYIGFPAYLKSNNNNVFVHSYKIYNSAEFFSAYNLTGKSCMNLVESIDFDAYYKCFVIGSKNAKVIAYDYSKPIHLRFNASEKPMSGKIENEIISLSLSISEYLGFSMNALEFGVKNNDLYLTCHHDPSPFIEREFLDSETYEWMLNATSEYLISVASGNASIPVFHPNTIFEKENLKGKSAVKRAKPNPKPVMQDINIASQDSMN
ncbi:MAG: hypothetical protein RO257_05990 [Candidatus Kapabacteria bacterium]|nr:hypothetical protein [Candidatus Kapabacteria bacterium]